MIQTQMLLEAEKREVFNEKQLFFIEPYLPKLSLSKEELEWIEKSQNHWTALREEEERKIKAEAEKERALRLEAEQQKEIALKNEATASFRTKIAAIAAGLAVVLAIAAGLFYLDADKAKNNAIEKTKIAEAAKIDAEKQKNIAKIQKDSADIQKNIAIESDKKATIEKNNALKQKAAAEANLIKFNAQKVKELLQQIEVYEAAGQTYFVCETYREVLKYEPTNRAAVDYLQNRCKE